MSKPEDQVHCTGLPGSFGSNGKTERIFKSVLRASRLAVDGEEATEPKDTDNDYGFGQHLICCDACFNVFCTARKMAH